MEDCQELERALAELAGEGHTEVHEDGEWLAELDGMQWELRPQGRHTVLHIWSGERNLARRVLRVADISPAGVRLEVHRFGQARPGKLEFLRRDGPRPRGRISREKFRARLRRLLAEKFPDSRVESMTAAQDLEHSFSGKFPRGVMVDGARRWALLGVAPQENAATVEEALAYGLLWLDWHRNGARRPPVHGLRLLLPRGGNHVTAARIRALSEAAHLEAYEFDESSALLEKIDLADAGNVDNVLELRRNADLLFGASAVWMEKFRELLPEEGPAIQCLPQPKTGEVSFRFRGMEFARGRPEALQFGAGDSSKPLAHGAWNELAMLLDELSNHRSPLATDVNHPLYRGAPERWLESMVLAEPARLDAQLDPRFLYSQVPAVAGGNRGVVDLLGVTRAGRLVVIELKASEDLQLPLQAVDYWLRVCEHHRSGNFQRCGYFAGVELDGRPPQVWLVAPGLRFHPATDALLRYLDPKMEITRIGLSEDWRQGLRVIFRQ